MNSSFLRQHYTSNLSFLVVYCRSRAIGIKEERGCLPREIRGNGKNEVNSRGCGGAFFGS